MKIYFQFFVLIFLFFTSPLLAQELTPELENAEFYFLMDADTKEVLLSRHADIRLPPSSMTKLMTAYVVFDQIKKGTITLKNQCLIGKDAWRKYGSSMFLNYGDVVSIEDLVKGLLIVSGNDAAIALAESTAGGFDNFVKLMNIKAKEFGLKNSHFQNPHGLNEDGHYMSLRDLATLSLRLYEDFPEYLRYLTMPEFTYGRVTQRNHNPLIRDHYEGVIGSKTGHTTLGGYGLAGIVKRDHRCLIAVVNRAKSAQQRAKVVTDLLDYGFINYKKLVLFESGQPVTKLKTWLGRSSEVEVVTNQEVALNLPREKTLSTIKARVKYEGPIYTPIVKGAKLATLEIDVEGHKTLEYSLFAKETVERVGYIRRVNRILRYKIANLLDKK